MADRTTQQSSTISRRRLLGTAAATTTGGLLVGTGVARGQPSFDGWFENVTNYDGVVDERGANEVTVTVGVQQGGGPFGFGPPAIQVDPGTTVTWEWNGKGGQHNVVAVDGTYKSDLHQDAGATFSHTFDSTGISKYYCSPHRPVGMKGAVVVGELPSAGSGGGRSLRDMATLAAGGLLGVGLVLVTVFGSWFDRSR